MNKFNLFMILTAVIVVGAFATISNLKKDVAMGVKADNVSVVDGIQIIEIQAKGGYQPRMSVAKQGLPTVIRFNTSGTFDCSSSVRIPSMNISRILPQSGITDIDIGSPQVATLKGTCGMGMYPFEVDFKS